MRAGYAEVVKYGLIGDARFFDWLEANWRAVFAGGPERDARRRASAAEAKAEIVAARRDARTATARCSTSATPSATRSRP